MCPRQFVRDVTRVEVLLSIQHDDVLLRYAEWRTMNLTAARDGPRGRNGQNKTYSENTDSHEDLQLSDLRD